MTSPTATPTGGQAPEPAAPVTIGATPPTVAPTTPPRSDRIVLPRASQTTASASASPSTSGPAAMACAASSGVAPYFGGYNATVTIRNTGRTTVQGWVMTFRIGDRQRVVSSWGASVSGPANGLQARDAGYNATIAPGASVQFGFQAEVPWGPGPSGPSGFALNGVACS